MPRAACCAIVRRAARSPGVSRSYRPSAHISPAEGPPIPALEIVKSIVDNSVLTRAIERARDAIREGQSIAPPLRESGLFPPLVVHMAAVGERSFGALLVLLAIPNMLAGVIPGLSIVLGLPLMLLSLQLIVAARRPWLPPRLARLEIRRSDLHRLVDKVSPRLRRLERALRPRLPGLTAPWAKRLIGVACLALSVFVFLPIPLANLLPAIGIMLFGFAILERDGLVAIAATAVTIVCLTLFGSVAFAFTAAAGQAIQQLG